jgi:cellulose synthase/poly-beta-1,6-N-acetylglucosamine synthase-like glycosyltransferase
MADMIIKMIFWLALFGSVYSYLIYPFILILINSRARTKPGRMISANMPKVSMIITVHNEEHRIREKLKNTLELEYPNDQLEIIVASDGSTDKTNNIVEEYKNKNVKLVEVLDHKGKENAQLHGIEASTGEILVFSDVATQIEKDALIKLVAYFVDETVGAVSSEDRFISKDGSIAGEGAYVKYEMWLRKEESKAAGLVGLSGSFFAARKSICQEWDIYSPSDFNTALNCAKNGMIAVTMPDVHGYYRDLSDSSKEYQRKLRTIIRGLTSISRHKEVLNPFKFGVFAFQVWSHKLLRWAVPWFLIALMITTLLIYSSGIFYSAIFIAQILFYLIVLVALVMPSMRENTFCKIPFFFIQVNLAIAHATILFLGGKRMVTWSPSKR